MASRETDVIAAIAHGVRRQRKARGLTLQQLADRSGVSKRTVAQVEARDTNPSIGVLARLAGALGVDLPDLLNERRPAEVTVVGSELGTVLWKSTEGSEGRLIVSGNPPGAPELWIFTLAAYDEYQGVPDPEPGQEVLLVLEGELELTIGAARHQLVTGAAAHLASAAPHLYRAGAAGTRFVKFALPGPPGV